MIESGISPADRRAIYDNLRRYAWHLDRADGDGIATTFTRDGYIESTQGRRFDDMNEFARNASSMAGFFGRQHHMQPMLVEKTDEGYIVTSYWMVMTQHAGGQPFLVYRGYYRDTCVREDGQWRFRKKVIGSWTEQDAPIIRRQG